MGEKKSNNITAKGKGEMQPYWLVDPNTKANNEDEEEEQKEETNHAIAMRLRDASLDELKEAVPPMIRHLVNWNIEILKKLL
jgi:hypothetical protein